MDKYINLLWQMRVARMPIEAIKIIASLGLEAWEKEQEDAHMGALIDELVDQWENGDSAHAASLEIKAKLKQIADFAPK